MFIPVNLHYTQDHLWIRPIGREDIYIGITDYAQKQLGRIDFIEIDQEGKFYKENEPFGIIYGSKKIFKLIMPINGKIQMANKEAKNNPRSLNSDTYNNWIAMITIVTETKEKDFLASIDYEKFINK